MAAQRPARVGVRRRAVGVAAFVVAAAGGAALAWQAERRTLGRTGLEADDEWTELQRPIAGRPVGVVAPDGTHLHAEVLGPDDAPTVVFAHGYALSQHAWHYQRRDLANRFRLVLYDQRGHARSEPAATGDWSVEALGHDLAAVIAATVPEGDPLLVVGHSMGGMAVLAMAGLHPELIGERVVGAVLIDTTGSDVLAGAVVTTGLAALSGVRSRVVARIVSALGRAPAVADRVYGASSDLSFVLTRAVGLNPDASPAQVAFVEQLLLNCPSSVLAALGPTLTSIDLRESVPALRVPALVLVGGRDRLTPPGSARALVEALPDAELIELPEVGHSAMLEAHAEVTAAIASFADRTFARTPAERARRRRRRPSSRGA